MELKRKRWRLKSYDKCFSGAEALEWLHTYLQNHPSFGDNVTREQAFMLLQKFLENSVFKNAINSGKNTKKFQDTNFLYKFNDNDNIKKENGDPKMSNKQNKENISSQNSLSNLLKNFARRNSRSISAEEYQQTPVGKVVDVDAPPAHKNDNSTRSRAVESCMTPLALDLDNISMASVRKPDVNQDYGDMSTILFDTADEDDVFDNSMSQSFFLRSNSLRLPKRNIQTRSKFTDFLDQEISNNTLEPITNLNSRTNTDGKKTKKQTIIHKFVKGSNSSPNSSSRRHTVTLGKRPNGNAESETISSPSKKSKILHHHITKSDSSLRNDGYTSSLLPRKAVVMLGEKPSLINKMSKFDSLNMLPGYKTSSVLPQKIQKSNLYNNSQNSSKTETNHQNTTLKADGRKFKSIENLTKILNKKCDHKQSYINPLVTKLIKQTDVKKKTKEHAFKQPSFIPMCTSDELPTSPTVIKSFRRILSPHPMRRRSLSQNNVPLHSKCQSVNDIHKVTMDLRKRKSHHPSNMNPNKGGLYKAPSMWSIDTIGLEDGLNENNISKTPTITSEDIEEAWKSVFLLSLKKLLGVERLSDYFDASKISGDTIMKNVNLKTSELTRELPDWLVSAMNCLIDWPNVNSNANDSVLQDLPNYPGFERDVYRAVKEHYHCNLHEPIMPCHLYPLLQECAEIMCVSTEGAIRLLQHITTLLPCWNRRQLQLIIQFMSKISTNDTLEISKDLPNKDLVIHSFFRLIVRKEKENITSVGFQDTVSIRVTSFLMDHYDAVFKAPSGLRVQVDHKLAVTLGASTLASSTLSSKSCMNINEKSSRPSSADGKPRHLMTKQRSFCKQITKEEYELEAKELTKKAIRDFLTTIIDDQHIPEKERKKRLQQIHKTYPDIYYERFSNGDDISNCSTSSQRSSDSFKHALKPSFLSEKIL